MIIKRKAGILMGQSVEDVIGELSEIEAAAVRIMNAADTRKKQLSEENDLKMKRFDEEMIMKTNASIEQLEEKLNAEKESELTRLKEETDAMLAQMQTKYENEHGAWSDEIVQAIVRM